MSAPSVLMLINTTGLQYDDRLRKESGSLQASGAAVQIVGLEYANRAGQSVVYDGVRARTIALRSRRWFPQSRGLVVKTGEMYLRFVAAVLALRPDVVWCHDLEMGGLIPLLAVLRALGLIKRVVWDQHELPPDGLRASALYRRMFGWLLRCCDTIVMANAERRTLVREWVHTPRTPIEVLNNYPDARFGEQPRQPLPSEVVAWLDGEPFLLAQGGANPDRHLNSLVAAVLRNRQFRLVVVGPFGARLVADLEQEHGSSLRQRVLFTGPVPQLELTRFIDHAYASVVLYQATSANTRLCAPNRLYQALIRGVPVVVGSNPPMADLVAAANCGIVLNTDGADVDDLCAALDRLESRHEELARAASVKRDLTWESQLAVVARIAGAQPSPAFTTVCLLPVATDARIQRRLTALTKLGVTPTVLAFDRPYYPGKPMAGGFECLGRIEHGNYLGRLRPLLSALPRVRAAGAAADVVYAFSLDLLALAWLATRGRRRQPKLVYEVADIHPTLVGRGFRASVMRAIERRLLRDASLLVVTSEAFITGFYHGIQGVCDIRYELVENKPELGQFEPPIPRPREEPGPIVIGYFGVIRCERSWHVLRRLAEQGNGRIHVYLRGVPLNLPNFEQQAAESRWIQYSGPYVAPDELADMYSRVDLLWVAHRVDDNNSLLWNRTNRFYEGCAFQKPMIGQARTQDGGVIHDRGLGPLVDLADPEAAIERVLQITAAEIEQWQANVSRLPRSVYCENGEHERLSNRIRVLASAV